MIGMVTGAPSCEAVRRELPGWTCYWTTIDPTTGKRQQYSKAFHLKKDAKEHLASILGSVLDGTFRRDTKLTLRTSSTGGSQPRGLRG